MKRTYMTEQKKALWNFLSENAHTPLTITDIAEGCSIGKSTAYRLMNGLVSAGLVSKILRKNGFVYQLSACVDCYGHLHLKCVTCGKIIHLSNSRSKLLKKEILEHYEFDPQDNNAMLYGKCNECMHEQETKK
ncbi:MAG TPA: helix-turn-helix domain-containing protein [Clostridiales bacterium]|jgi:Fur family ferric uptake transcriptional regulator|nr:helix-turn-helix domain-containing protein [Clostridiales bacterium]